MVARGVRLASGGRLPRPTRAILRASSLARHRRMDRRGDRDRRVRQGERWPHLRQLHDPRRGVPDRDRPARRPLPGAVRHVRHRRVPQRRRHAADARRRGRHREEHRRAEGAPAAAAGHRTGAGRREARPRSPALQYDQTVQQLGVEAFDDIAAGHGAGPDRRRGRGVRRPARRLRRGAAQLGVGSGRAAVRDRDPDLRVRFAHRGRHSRSRRRCSGSRSACPGSRCSRRSPTSGRLRRSSAR